MTIEGEQDEDLVVEIGADPAVEVPLERTEEAPKPSSEAQSIDLGKSPETPTVAPVAPVEDPTAALRSELDALRRTTQQLEIDRENERRLRNDAERIASERSAEAERGKVAIVDAQLQAVSSALAAEKAEAKAIERAMRQALAEKDYDLHVKAQTALMQSVNRIAALEEGQTHLKSAREVAANRPAPTVQTQAERPSVPAQPMTHETMISRFTPRTQEFLRKNDASWVTDEKSNNKLRAAHFSAVADGHIPDSDSYFDAVGRMMNGKPIDTPAPAQVATPTATAAKRTTAPAAPVSRKGANQPDGGGGMKVTLSPRQQQAAKDLGLSLTEYAKRVHTMTQPGWAGPKFGQNT